MRQILTFMRIPKQNTSNFTCNYTETLNFADDESGKKKSSSYTRSSFTNRRTFIKTLIKIYIKIRRLLHVSVYDHHQGACCVLCSAQHTVHTPYWDMLPHHHVTNDDVTLLFFYYQYNFSQAQLQAP